METGEPPVELPEHIRPFSLDCLVEIGAAQKVVTETQQTIVRYYNQFYWLDEANNRYQKLVKFDR